MPGTWTGTVHHLRRTRRRSAMVLTARGAHPRPTTTIIRGTAATSTAGSTRVPFTSPMRSSRRNSRRATARLARNPSIIIWWVIACSRGWCNRRLSPHARRRIRMTTYTISLYYFDMTRTTTRSAAQIADILDRHWRTHQSVFRRKHFPGIILRSPRENRCPWCLPI